MPDKNHMFLGDSEIFSLDEELASRIEIMFARMVRKLKNLRFTDSDNGLIFNA